MVKTSVKFQKNRNKTFRKVHTTLGGRRTYGHTEGRKAESCVPPLFPEKVGDNKLHRGLKVHLKCIVIKITNIYFKDIHDNDFFLFLFLQHHLHIIRAPSP